MKYFRKAFLFVVGLVAVAYDEANQSLEEAAKSLDDRREKLNLRRKA